MRVGMLGIILDVFALVFSARLEVGIWARVYPRLLIGCSHISSHRHGRSIFLGYWRYR